MSDRRDLNELNDAVLLAYTAAPPKAREEMLLDAASRMAELAMNKKQPTLGSLNADIGELAGHLATLAIALSQEAVK